MASSPSKIVPSTGETGAMSVSLNNNPGLIKSYQAMGPHRSMVHYDTEFWSITPFRWAGELPEAFTSAPVHVRAKVDQPSLGCPDCIRNYIRGGAASLKPHLRREDIIKTLKYYTRVYEVSDERFNELVDEGFSRRGCLAYDNAGN